MSNMKGMTLEMKQAWGCSKFWWIFIYLFI